VVVAEVVPLQRAAQFALDVLGPGCPGRGQPQGGVDEGGGQGDALPAGGGYGHAVLSVTAGSASCAQTAFPEVGAGYE
jgi:hypothetical protein